MAKLSRMTLDSIDSLVDESKILKVGEGTIEPCYWKNHCLKIKTPKETRKIKTPMSVWQLDGDEFLEYVNEFLNNNRLYLANVEYRTSAGLLLSKLSGMFYKEKTN